MINFSEDYNRLDKVADWTIKNMLLILDEPPQLAKRVSGLFKANYDEIMRREYSYTCS